MGSIKDAYNGPEGAKIVKIREMTKKEADAECWDLSHDGCRVLILDNPKVLGFYYRIYDVHLVVYP